MSRKIRDADRKFLHRLLRWEESAAKQIGADRVSAMLVSEALRVLKIIYPHMDQAHITSYLEEISLSQEATKKPSLERLN